VHSGRGKSLPLHEANFFFFLRCSQFKSFERKWNKKKADVLSAVKFMARRIEARFREKNRKMLDEEEIFVEKSTNAKEEFLNFSLLDQAKLFAKKFSFRFPSATRNSAQL
jgi:hypothetical protein